MNTNQYSDVDKEIKSELMQYAVTQYGGVYEEVFYETAVDATQRYVLCLKDSQGRVFNVYEEGKSGERTDNYKNSIVDDKMQKHLSERLNIEIKDASFSVMTVMNINVDVDTLEAMSLQECLERFELYSLIFACHFEGEKGSIYNQAEAILDVYRQLGEIKTETIDFNVVVTSGDASDVMDTLQNMRYRYSGSWYTCENVQEYISKANPQLITIDDIKALVKE